MKISLRCHHTHIFRDGALSQEVDIFLKIINVKGHPNCMIGSKVTAFLLESVKQRVMITLHIGTTEIIT